MPQEIPDQETVDKYIARVWFDYANHGLRYIFNSYKKDIPGPVLEALLSQGIIHQQVEVPDSQDPYEDETVDIWSGPRGERPSEEELNHLAVDAGVYRDPPHAFLTVLIVPKPSVSSFLQEIEREIEELAAHVGILEAEHKTRCLAFVTAAVAEFRKEEA